jgi:hypothetical protein
VLFTVIPSAHAPAMVAWTTFRATIDRGADAHTSLERQHALRGIPQPSSELSVTVWRLLATNNREIARCAYGYHSIAKARANARLVRSRADDVVIATIHGPVAGSHGWFATLDNGIALTCSRWYETSSLSLEAADGAIDALRHAVISRTIRSASR